MQGRRWCHSPSGHCILRQHTGLLRNCQIKIRSVICLLSLLAHVSINEETFWKRFPGVFFRVSVSSSVSAAAPAQAGNGKFPTETESGPLPSEAAEVAYEHPKPFSTESYAGAIHTSLGYWADLADSAGEKRVEAYAVVESAENAATYLGPAQLESVTHLFNTTPRVSLVKDDSRFKQKHFEILTAELRDLTQIRFRPYTSHPAKRLQFKQAAPAEFRSVASAVQNYTDGHSPYQGHEIQIGSFEPLRAVRRSVGTKISVLVGSGTELRGTSRSDPISCSAKQCGTEAKTTRYDAAGAGLEQKIQKRTDGSHGLLECFVSEIGVPVPEAELEKELRWELRIWRYIPSWRARELAEKEHILIPMSVLRSEKQGARFENKQEYPKSQRFSENANYNKSGSSAYLQTIAGSSSRGRAQIATDARIQEAHSWTDRVSQKVYNVFIYYPRAYKETLGSSLIPSDQITETWFRSATTDFMLSISTQMILALANFNSYGLVHTHIRPSSFVLDLDGVVLLSDLHRAVAVGETMDCLSDRVDGINDLTASPEESVCMYKYATNFEEHNDRKENVAGPMQAEFPVDSWRLGIILYRLWCREPAHDRRSDHEFHLRHLKARAAGQFVSVDAYLEENRLPMQYCRKDIPSSLQRLIRQMLVAEPAFRTTAADAVKSSSLFYNSRHQKEQAANPENGGA